MHYILGCLGSLGDLIPFARIGNALVERGHRVTCLSSRIAEGLFKSYGVDFVCIIENKDEKILGPEDVEAIARERMPSGIMPAYQFIEENYVPNETLVIAQLRVMGARMAWEKLGTPMLSVLLAPFEFGRFVNLGIDRVNAIRQELDLPPVKDLVNWVTSPQGILGLFPHWLYPMEPHWPSQTTLLDFPLGESFPPPRLGPEETAFFEKDEPYLVFYAGHLTPNKKLLNECFCKITKSLGKRAVILGEPVPGVSREDCLFFPFFSLDKLLSGASAMIHAGGIGACAESFRAGIPQIICPYAWDQKDQARRIEELRLGYQVTEAMFEDGQLESRLGSMLNDGEIIGNCSQLPTHFKGASAMDKICDFLEEFPKESAFASDLDPKKAESV